MKFGFSYHHAKQPKHAKQDFEELYNHGVESILIAASEFDHWYWFDNMVEIVDIAKDIGMKVWWNFWGFGHVFGGEPPSIFLDRNHRYRQITALSQEPIPAACPNTTEFRTYLFDWVEKVVKNIKIDGIFIDEPHFLTFDEDEYTCTCPTCKQKFQADFGYEMPRSLTEDVLKFRHASLISLISEMGSSAKKTNPNIEVSVCLLPVENNLYGIMNYEDILKINSLDVISLDPYYIAFNKDLNWGMKKTTELADLGLKYGKKTMIWLQLFNVPEKEFDNEVQLLDYYISKNIDEIFFWSFLANKGTNISCENPLSIYNKIIEKIRDYKKFNLQN